MKRKLFTFLVAFLATLSGAVWGQETKTIGGNTDDKLEINQKNANIEISMASDYKKSNDQIIIAKDLGEITITLNNVDIDVRLKSDTQTGGQDSEVDNNNAGNCAMEINSGTIVTLIWKGTNKLWSSSQRAGINVKPGATLILKGPDTEDSNLEAGSLCNGSASKITHGAGIGGDGVEPSFGTIIIESGNITAISQAKENTGTDDFNVYAAGIGGGYGSDNSTSTEGTIIIKGGNVVASNEHYTNGTLDTSNSMGAGIGGGKGGTCTSITITGGNVTAKSGDGYDIGNGYDTADDKAEDVPIIIAPESKDSDLTVTTSGDYSQIDKANCLIYEKDDDKATLVGKIALPADMQIYAPGIENKEDVIAYRVELEDSQIGDTESPHTHTGFPAELNDTYYGPTSNSKTVPITSEIICEDSHFIGWYSNNTTDSKIESNVTVNIPTEEIKEGTGKVLYKGTTVWVNKKRTITVNSGHTWTANDEESDAPSIYVSPNEASVLNLLSFKLEKTENAGKRLENVDFSTTTGYEHVLEGTPKLLDTESYWRTNGGDVKAFVSIKDSEDKAKEVAITITVSSDNIRITNVTVTGDHTYDGIIHNNVRSELGGNEYTEHLLQVSAQIVEGDQVLEENTPVKENIHYYISSYTFTPFGSENGTPAGPATGDKSLDIINAGTYTNVKLIAKGGTKFSGDKTEYTLTGPIVIKQAELTWTSTSTEVQYTAGEAEPTWDDLVKVSGKMEGDDVSATLPTPTISGETDAWKTKPGKYTVTFAKATTLTGSDASNYTMTKDLELTLIVKGSAENVDIKPGTDSPWNMAGDGTFSHVYDGTVPKIGTLAITVTGVNESVILTENEDFTVDYTNVAKDVKDGGYTATITFEENDYITTGDTKEVSLYITARPLNITFKDEVASMEGLTVTDLVVPDNLVSGEIPTYNGTIQSEETGENTYKVTITGFKVENSTTFTSTNYVIKVNGNDYTEGETIVIDKVTVDPDDEGDDDHNPGHGGSDINRPAKYYNIYVDTAATSDGVELSLSKDVVKEGNQVSVYIDKILEGYDAENMKVQIKRSLYGYWEEIEEGVQPDEYVIYNIYHDIYVKVTDVVKEDATGIDDLEGVKAYAKDGSIYVYTPNREEVTIISMSGVIIKNEEQVGLQSYSVSCGIYIVRIGDKVFKLKN